MADACFRCSSTWPQGLRSAATQLAETTGPSDSVDSWNTCSSGHMTCSQTTDHTVTFVTATVAVPMTLILSRMPSMAAIVGGRVRPSPRARCTTGWPSRLTSSRWVCQGLCLVEGFISGDHCGCRIGLDLVPEKDNRNLFIVIQKFGWFITSYNMLADWCKCYI